MRNQYNRQDYYTRNKSSSQAIVDSHDPIQAKPLEVKVGDNFDKAFKIFRSIVQKERVISTFKERQSYEKPSVRRRRKRAESQQKRNEAESKGGMRDRDDKPRIKVMKEQKKEAEILQ